MSSLFIVQNGALARLSDNGHEDRYGVDDFFGGYELPPSEYEKNVQTRTIAPSSLFEIPRTVFAHIPIVLWKLFESHGKRLSGWKS